MRRDDAHRTVDSGLYGVVVQTHSAIKRDPLPTVPRVNVTVVNHHVVGWKVDVDVVVPDREHTALAKTQADDLEPTVVARPSREDEEPIRP